MAPLEILGIIAGILTTSGFVPQVYKTYKTKSAKDLSLGMFTLFCAGIVLWLIYGFAIQSIAIIATNIATLLLSLCLIYFKFKYK